MKIASEYKVNGGEPVNSMKPFLSRKIRPSENRMEGTICTRCAAVN